VFLANAKTTFVAKDPTHFHLYFPPALSADGLWINTTKKAVSTTRRCVARWAWSSTARTSSSRASRATTSRRSTTITGIPLPAGDPFIAAEYKDKPITGDVAAAKKVLTDAGSPTPATRSRTRPASR